MFTIPEKRLLDSPYFIIVQTNDNYYEIQSVCTGHYWIIRKNSSGSLHLITLYHRNSLKHKYYHKQGLCISVNAAIQMIQHHDSYVLSSNLN